MSVIAKRVLVTGGLVTERLQLLAEPLRPVAVALPTADENIEHAGMIGARAGEFKLRLKGYEPRKSSSPRRHGEHRGFSAR
jgi:hypothetical protein